ncbi:ATP-dependent RNA helicase TDRD9-like isoform X1 [Liolophura sinensis]|uniref:ATP-dependent RNA helicase TDRD9-like isoform X1 n=1 Tax=Liolophura sinensis TaxID=3198878 RepID=UPI003157F83E
MAHFGGDITLDQIDSWFTIGKKITEAPSVPRGKRKGLRTDPSTQTVIQGRQHGFVPPYKRHDLPQQDYVEQYKELEMQAVTQGILQEPPADGLGLPTSRDMNSLSQLELDSTIAGGVGRPDDLIPENAMDVYNNYDFTINYDNSAMPITQFKDQIIATVESNQVTVIQGSTGSGKTTQVPQYILANCAEKHQYCNIIVTQPRKIAAMSIARRVCAERNWDLGTICGYQVGLDKTAGEDTRLLYVTTGTLLRKLINAKTMTQFTHVILDEVHERDQETDFALLVVRKFLRTNSRHVKVILMSATLQSDLFAQYFAVPFMNRLEPAPVLTVEGKMFSVSEYYAGQLEKLGPLPYLDAYSPSIPEESQHLAVKLIQEFDTLEAKEQGRTKSGFAPVRGSVLVFLPGYEEIRNVEKKLDEIASDHKLICLPLHSSITIEEQVKVFEPAPKHHRKVILSTNIAESSITVPDIKYVIDFCLTKQLVCDPQTNYTSLILEWASKSNCTQRKGRAGRVSHGRVYRLVPQNFYDMYIQEHGVPEMQRCPLERLILEVKLLDLGEPKAILALALSPPRLEDIEKTVLFLKEVGALSQVQHGPYNPHDGDLTFVGRVLAKLPVDIRIGKLLILGHVFGLLEECLIIGAALSLKSIFAKPYREHLMAYKTKLAWSDGSFSDCLAVLTAYRTWSKMKSQQNFRRSGQSEMAWGRSKFLQIRRLKEVVELAKELEDRLKKHNIIRPTPEPHFKRNSSDAEERLFLKLVFCGAFYPNYFVQEKLDERDAFRSLSGKDPFKTVMIKGFPPNHGSLYKAEVEMMFKCCDSEPRAHFEETRGFVEFCSPQSERMGKVHRGVYFAVKMRSLRMPLQIHLFTNAVAQARLEKIQADSNKKAIAEGRLRTHRLTLMSSREEEEMRRRHINHQVPFPDVRVSLAEVFVTEVVECGHFWVQYKEKKNIDDLTLVHADLNRIPLQPMTCRVKSGMYCAAPYNEPTFGYFRAKVKAVHIQGRETEVEVFFVDFGNTDILPLSALRELPAHLEKIPFQAIECELMGLRPSIIKRADGQWSPQATLRFKDLVLEKECIAQIYSIVGGVMRVTLFTMIHQNQQVNVNEELILYGFAEPFEENIVSKQNHASRAEEKNRRALAEMYEDTAEKFDWLQLHMDSTHEPNTKERGKKTGED